MLVIESIFLSCIAIFLNLLLLVMIHSFTTALSTGSTAFLLDRVKQLWLLNLQLHRSIFLLLLVLHKVANLEVLLQHRKLQIKERVRVAHEIIIYEVASNDLILRYPLHQVDIFDPFALQNGVLEVLGVYVRTEICLKLLAPGKD